MSLAQFRGLWKGRTVACIASGPSLTAEDCERVRAAGLPTVVVNNSWELAPWADILFAMDAAWWSNYGDRVMREFEGHRIGYVRVPGVIATKGEIFPTGWGNSGTYAISVAVVTGAARILLLGYDCQMTGGRNHWHVDHPVPMGNCGTIKSWAYKAEIVAKYAKSHGVSVINCSRETALTCFARGTLDDELMEARAA